MEVNLPFKTGSWGEQEKIRSRNRWLSYRLRAIEKLGNHCIKCGFTDIRALQIDHINGSACAERKKRGYANNYPTIRDVLNGNTENYQLLCANCNWIKRWENNECKRIPKEGRQ